VADWILAFFPILVILVLMLGFRWGGARAGPAGWLAALFIAYGWFGAGWELLAYAQLKAALLTLFVLYIIWPALLFYRVADEAGVIEAIGSALTHLTRDRALQALLLGWVFSAFLQSIGGFGVPVAIVAPLLVGLGFPPLAAVVIPSIGHSWAVTFGSLASSFYALIAATGRSGAELAPWSAVMLGVAAYACGAGTLWAAGGFPALRQEVGALLVIGTAMGVTQYLVVTHGLWSIGGLSAGLVGLAVGVIWAYVQQQRRNRATSATSTASAPSRQDANPALSPALALTPYALLVAIVMAAQFVPPVRSFLNQVVIRVSFPELRTARGWVTPAGVGRTIRPFGHAGALLIYASVLTYGLFRRRGAYPPDILSRLAHGVVSRAIRSSLGIAAMVGMAVMMDHAGMIRVLALGVAQVTGRAYPFAAPFIGVLGAFVTGSNTNSNVLFGALQQEVAGLIQANPLIILAAQTAGGAIGGMFAPAKVIVGCSTVGLGGDEGPVMKKASLYGLLITAGLGLVTVLALLVAG